MYAKKFSDLEKIGPAFEELSDEEMMITDGGVTPTVVLSVIGKACVSGLVGGAVTCTIIVIFD